MEQSSVNRELQQISAVFFVVFIWDSYTHNSREKYYVLSLYWCFWYFFFVSKPNICEKKRKENLSVMVDSWIFFHLKGIELSHFAEEILNEILWNLLVTSYLLLRLIWRLLLFILIFYSHKKNYFFLVIFIFLQYFSSFSFFLLIRSRKIFSLAKLHFYSTLSIFYT